MWEKLLSFCAEKCPFFISCRRSFKLKTLTPENEAGIAVVGGPGAVDVAALEVWDLDKPILRRLWVCALNLWKTRKTDAKRNLNLNWNKLHDHDMPQPTVASSRFDYNSGCFSIILKSNLKKRNPMQIMHKYNSNRVLLLPFISGKPQVCITHFSIAHRLQVCHSRPDFSQFQQQSASSSETLIRSFWGSVIWK